MIAAYGELPALCEHLHLPVQSGSNRILAAMNRGYSREAYLEKVAQLRQSCPGIAISTDLIVGFPGETEADFAETLDLMREAAFDQAFSFKYSPRPQTRAAGLPGTAPGAAPRVTSIRTSPFAVKHMAEYLQRGGRLVLFPEGRISCTGSLMKLFDGTGFLIFKTRPKVITVNAWNEWPEGSVLEPEQEYGYGYLEAIKAVFGAQ